MAKTLDQVVQERIEAQLGAMVVQSIAHIARIEALEAEIAALKAAATLPTGPAH